MTNLSISVCRSCVCGALCFASNAKGTTHTLDGGVIAAHLHLKTFSTYTLGYMPLLACCFVSNRVCGRGSSASGGGTASTITNEPNAI